MIFYLPQVLVLIQLGVQGALGPVEQLSQSQVGSICDLTVTSQLSQRSCGCPRSTDSGLQNEAAQILTQTLTLTSVANSLTSEAKWMLSFLVPYFPHLWIR